MDVAVVFYIVFAKSTFGRELHVEIIKTHSKYKEQTNT